MMAKSLFLFLISVIASVLWTPGILMADNYDLKKTPYFDDVETVIVSKDKDTNVASSDDKPKVQSLIQPANHETHYEPRQEVHQAVHQEVRPKTYSNSFSFNGKTLELVMVDNPAIDASNHVNRFSNMFYGHNSPEVFQSLGSASSFSISSNGVVTNYRVMEKHVFEKYSPTQLSLNGEVYSMASLAHRAWGYDVIVLTCAGQPLGNGDATHRLVLFANKI